MTCSFSPSEKCAVRNVLARVWRPHLSSDEHFVLTYLIDNTIEWGREIFDFTWEQIKAGIPSDEGVEWPWRLPPIGDISRASFYRVVASLVSKGALMREAIHRTCTHLSICLTWAPLAGMMTMKLAISRAKAAILGSQPETQVDEAEAEIASLGLTMRRNGSQAETPIKQNDLTERMERNIRPGDTSPHASRSGSYVPFSGANTQSKARHRERPTTKSEAHEEASRVPSPAPVKNDNEPSARDVISAAQSNHRARMTESARIRRLEDSLSAYTATWRQAWAETYLGVPCPAFGKKEGGMLAAVLKKRFPHDVAARHDFLDFNVRNWSGLMAGSFGWMTRTPPPEMPSVPFLCTAKFAHAFTDAFVGRKRFEAIQLLPVEQRELERMIATGMSREEAIASIGERRGLSRAHEELHEARRISGENVRKEEERRRRETQERRARDRAAFLAAKEQEAAAPADAYRFAELEEMEPIEIELAPVDLSKWS